MQVARVAVMHEVQDKNSRAQESNGAWLGPDPQLLKPETQRVFWIYPAAPRFQDSFKLLKTIKDPQSFCLHG